MDRSKNFQLRFPGSRLLSAMVMAFFLFVAGCDDPVSKDGQSTTVGPDANDAIASSAAQTQVHTNTVIFDGGTDGYHSYRIPSIIKTNNGTLIAFAEGRRWSPSDWGDINLVYKRSANHGVTWSALGEVVGSGNGTWGNPTAVYDWKKGPNGRVWLFMSWNDGTHTSWSSIDSWGDRRVFHSYSDDHGATWSVPADLTNTLLPPDYKWDAMGPGIGIQTTVNRPGRLIIPAYGRNIYSDDGGATWQYQLIPGGTDEGTIVELANGTLMRNDRAGTTLWEVSKRRRKSTGSIENGFSSWISDAALLDPKCEASMIRYNTDYPARIIFLNPASTERRCKMRVRISYDEGQTWPISRRIHDWLTDTQTCDQGKGGYSSMIKTADYMVGALIEMNEDVSHNSTSNKSIEFHKFNLAWILNGATEP